MWTISLNEPHWTYLCAMYKWLLSACLPLKIFPQCLQLYSWGMTCLLSMCFLTLHDWLTYKQSTHCHFPPPRLCIFDRISVSSTRWNWQARDPSLKAQSPFKSNQKWWCFINCNGPSSHISHYAERWAQRKGRLKGVFKGGLKGGLKGRSKRLMPCRGLLY